MRTLIFSGIYPPDVGGPATFIPQLERYLSSQGREYHTITLADQLTSMWDSEDSLTFVSRSLPLTIRVMLVISEGLRRSRNTAVIFSNGLYEEAAIVSKLTNRPLICKVVGIPAWEAQQRFQQDQSRHSQGLETLTRSSLSMALRVRNRIWEWSLRQARLIITPSMELEKYLNSLDLNVPVKLIENGTDIKNMYSNSHKFDVVTTSRLVPWKNLDILIDAAREYDFTLAIAGDGPERERLKVLAENHPNIHFLGVVNPNSVSDLLMSSKVFALVSSYEGLSYSLIEALAIGKACVLSKAQGNVGAIKDSDVALMVPVRDVEETGKAIRKLLDNESFRKKLEKDSLEFAQVHYDKIKQLEKVVKTFDEG